MKKFVLFALSVLMTFSLMAAPLAEAQTSATHVKRNIATVMFAGLGGAVLGTSTLSFYSSPSEHTGNIWVGLAVGLVVGSIYVVNREMQAPATDYGKVQWPTNPSQRVATQNQMNLYNYKFSF